MKVHGTQFSDRQKVEVEDVKNGLLWGSQWLNQVASPGHLTMEVYFLLISEASSPKSWYPWGWLLLRPLSPACRQPSPPRVPHTVIPWASAALITLTALVLPLPPSMEVPSSSKTETLYPGTVTLRTPGNHLCSTCYNTHTVHCRRIRIFNTREEHRLTTS